MSDLFDVYSSVQQVDCDKFALDYLRQPVTPVLWQGYYSYTLVSQDDLTIIQFRAAQSPLDQELVNLAHQIHPEHVPVMTFLGTLPDSDVSIWKMDRVAGMAAAMMSSDPAIRQKLPTTVADMARFFAADWKCPQVPSKEYMTAVRGECEVKLDQLGETLPSQLQPYVTQCKDALVEIMERLPWVLTHDDLSNMNILLNADTGHLQGIVDWADASSRPFGMALWGLESVLGHSTDNGWAWHEDESNLLHALFFDILEQEVGEELLGKRHLIGKARVLGLLLRYGFVWQNNTHVPTNDATTLAALLDRNIAEQIPWIA